MLNYFLLENLHFAINVITALIIFSIFWLYLDAWQMRKTAKDAMKFIGFVLLALSYIFHATVVETSLLTLFTNSNHYQEILVRLTRIPGLMFILVGNLTDPIQRKPSLPGSKNNVNFFSNVLTNVLDVFDKYNKVVYAVSIVIMILMQFIPNTEFIYPILTVLIAFFYLFRATVGLEHHLKALTFGFFLISLSDLLHLSALLQKALNSDLYRIGVPFGPIWLLAHIILLIATFILGRWIFSYLLTRFKSQLFILFTTLVIVIFIITAFTFTFLLLKNLENENLRQLETNVKVLQFALESHEAENLADAEVISYNSTVQKGLTDKSSKVVTDMINTIFVDKKQTSLLVVDENGQIIARAEDNENIGDSFSDNSSVKKAFAGESTSSVIQRNGVLTPEVLIQSAVPIKNEDKITGVVLASTVIDNTFVSGLKKTTGLEATLYSGNQITATTLSGSENVSYVGIQEGNEKITAKVLKNGENYFGTTNIGNVPYFGAYVPLKDSDNIPIGMLFVGAPQVSIFQVIGRSIQLTFIAVLVLIVLSVIPIHYISRYIAYQVK